MLCASLLITFVAGSLPIGTKALSPARVSAQTVTVDPAVLADTRDGQAASFLVVLQRQADARRAGLRTADRRERGQAVVSTLRQAADDSQPTLQTELAVRGTRYR
jgi:hypothetical protein